MPRVSVNMSQWGRGAESVSFDDESFGDICEVGHHVRDVT